MPTGALWGVGYWSRTYWTPLRAFVWCLIGLRFSCKHYHYTKCPIGFKFHFRHQIRLGLHS